MSGSGGSSGYSGISPKVRIAESTQNVQASQQKLEINEFLEELLKEFNNRDVEAIQKHLNEIEKALGKELNGLDSILFGGSISKKTFIEGFSDVDALVFLDSTKYKEFTPKELQERFASLLKEHFPKTDITKGTLAVTVKFSDYEIQLLPALKVGKKIVIADRSGNAWSNPINVQAFSSKLTAINKANNNKVVPVIKLVKNLVNNIPQEYRPTGYHVEALAVDAFAVYNGGNRLYDMTKYVLEYSVKRVLNPVVDVTGQSIIVDDNLGPSKSVSRQRLSNYFKDLASRFSGSDAVAVTKELFK